MRTVIGSNRDGYRVVKVPLDDTDNPPYAILNEEIWRELLELGIVPKFDIDKNGMVQVWCPKIRRYVHVVDLVADIDETMKVDFIDGDKTNLRTNNLVIKVPRPKKYRDFLSDEFGRANQRFQYEWEYLHPIFKQQQEKENING